MQRQPFQVWMLDCVGPLGVKRLKPEHRRRIPGVIGFCRKVFERQVPFDPEFRLDDAALYCLELTEKAFRSQGLALSKPVRIGDWENLNTYPLAALATPFVTRFTLGRPITWEQPVYVPGNEHQGIWASPILETVFGPESNPNREAALGHGEGYRPRGDFDLVIFGVNELSRSYAELPVRWICDLTRHPRVQGLLAARDPDSRRAGPKGSGTHASIPIGAGEATAMGLEPRALRRLREAGE
jgi:hypothetical protein